MSPFIIPIFISHQGCPHQCVFCNQHSITGRLSCQPVTSETVTGEISVWLKRKRYNRQDIQVAFYGGSFTGLPVVRQQELLELVRPFIAHGTVGGIRISTRPDYIDDETVDFLLRHGVKTVELGIQSMDDRVLAASERGHTAAQAVTAIERLRQGGLVVGTQLMVGLPHETTKGLFDGAKDLAAMRPDFVRIYPVVVVSGSKLADLYLSGDYLPLSLNRAIIYTARIKEIFDRYSIPIVRMGLQPTAILDHEVIAGPYHPAFGELVLSYVFLKKVRKALQFYQGKGGCTLLVAAQDQSIFQGHRNRNLHRLQKFGFLNKVKIIFDKIQPRYVIRIVGS